MEENIKNENRNNQQHIVWKVLGIFAFAITLICFFVFVFNITEPTIMTQAVVGYRQVLVLLFGIIYWQ